MPTVQPTPSTTAGSSKSTVVNPNSGMDKDAFLKLLITQLKYQDPMKPMDDTQFIAQMAQFSSLEQMTNISTAMGALNTSMGTLNGGQLAGQALSLVGRTITAQDPADPTKTITGVVSQVEFEKGVPMLLVGKSLIGLEKVMSVVDGANPSD